MNEKQKICVMVAVGSVVVFLISTLFLGFDGTVIEPHPDKESIELHGFLAPMGYRESVNTFRIKYLFKQNNNTNWLGIISAVNIAVSITGLFLFKDK